MKVLFATAECAPFFKTGGLGDVAGALPQALKDQGVDISVVLPYFTKMPAQYQNECEDLIQFPIEMGEITQPCTIKTLERQQVRYYFIENAAYFDREQLYSYEDDGERFAFFSLSIIQLAKQLQLSLDYIHCNDHHTAIIPFLLKEKYQKDTAYQSVKSMLTIHNIEFQGKYAPQMLPELFGLDLAAYHERQIFDQDGLNFMKAGILYADQVTTVSPSYAKELQTPDYGYGLDPLLREKNAKLTGILNGIDYEVYDPGTDPLIPAHFSSADLSGKEKDKQALQTKMNLPVVAEVPLIGMVSRLTYQKGFPLVLSTIQELLQHDVQVVLLGTGDPALEEAFQQLAKKYSQKLRVNLQFDPAFAQLIYAGADLFLMPSKFEPCGLSQMIAMRYGTLPLVHETGGLRDTVVPYQAGNPEATGFSFDSFQASALVSTFENALTLFQTKPETWRQMITNAMSKDFSWQASSQVYLQLYHTQ